MARKSSGKLTLSVAILTALLASGCATDRMSTGSVQRGGQQLSQMTVDQLSQEISVLSRQYDKRPKDKRIGLRYADALRTAGRNEQALAVMQQMVILHPEDNNVLAAYGKALASSGELLKALNIIERAQRPDNPDWKLLSAQGAVLDQLDRPQEARNLYKKALQIAPNEASIYSNLGMSHLLTNELPTSEKYLKNALRLPRADSRVRQNLALVVGLQGRFDEAERIAAGELSKQDAEANISYLRQMLSQQNAWNQIKKEDG